MLGLALNGSGETIRKIVDLNDSWKFYPGFAEVERTHAFLGGATSDKPEHQGWIEARNEDDQVVFDVILPRA